MLKTDIIAVAFQVNDANVIVQAGPYLHWTVGQKASVIDNWLRKKQYNYSVTEVKEQANG